MRRTWLRILAVTFTLAGTLVLPQTSKTVQAACTNPASPYGVSTVSVASIPAGTYRVWSRIIAPDTTNNSYYLQVDGGCAINVGDSAITANALTWVDYQDGNSATKTNVTLAAGAHTFVLTGKEPGVSVDKVVLSVNASCVPSGTGDAAGNNCADPTATPSPGATATPTPVATVTPTPVPTNAADLNHDSKVNVFDLSVLLTNWGKTGTGDIDGNGTVNVFDLSRLLTAWTG